MKKIIMTFIHIPFPFQGFLFMKMSACRSRRIAVQDSLVNEVLNDTKGLSQLFLWLWEKQKLHVAFVQQTSTFQSIKANPPPEKCVFSCKVF